MNSLGPQARGARLEKDGFLDRTCVHDLMSQQWHLLFFRTSDATKVSVSPVRASVPPARLRLMPAGRLGQARSVGKCWKRRAGKQRWPPESVVIAGSWGPGSMQ